MFDIITFGSATKDIYLKTKDFQIIRNQKFATGKGFCFGLGSKVEAEDVYFASGGGGTNTAATFAKQGLKTAYCGAVGKDIAGKEIIEELKKLGINSQFVSATTLRPTNHSIILSGLKEDRTIFVYRGASEILGVKDIPWKKLKAKWFYIAPLSGKLCSIFETIVDFAHKNKIKIAVNPGNCQLSLPKEKLKKILKKIDILILNQEEAAFLTKIPYQQEIKIFQEIDKICPGIAIMTKGCRGAVVSDGKYLYRADAPKTKIVDQTGAGDSFASGFLSGFIRSKGSIEYAIQFGISNAFYCLQKIGAKEGLLEKNGKLLKIKVEKTSCLENNHCVVKRC